MSARPGRPATHHGTEAREAPEQKRILTVLVISQVLSGAGLAAGITVGALLAEEMLGSTGLAGVPSALFTAGGALGAVAVGRLCQRWGRRPGLSLGYVIGAVGSLGVVAAAVADNVPLLFLSLLVYGAGTSTSLLARYAGADLASPARRGRAVSTVLFATTLGAVVGPVLVSATGDVAHAWGMPRLTGPFLLAVAAFTAAAVAIGAFLRPDPLLLARELAEAAPAPGSQDAGDTTVPAGRTDTRGLVTGTAVMVLTQLVMIAIMTMTPVHMRAHGHDTQAAGLVIALHVGAMFLPSPLTGLLVDRFGRQRIAAASGLILLCAGVLAAVAPPHSTATLAAALVLLGVGWNFGLISGTALVTDAVPLDRRAGVQGLVDVGIALAGATGGMASGAVVAAGSFPVLAAGGAVLALAIVPVAALSARDRRTPPERSPRNTPINQVNR
ncbi:MFS transporter [Streptomyces albireticuli]|uniref:MFS transporter n=1 Tax=Streptomyces albireticuli TaxID=1940 RepID=A0A2A2D1B4_9ACTN|nr:MFS transporter [Streptomyces albireticuli]MCD9141346.1 MFS transporter [Streptomyces albireticuli]MCD9160693.1 MFS transporter [Streptomyces albireticuli]MCD9195751.1 MFS transporter [Streptomyces albireticuli]PAU45247.1 MFS transporter [Streptomyces albireticuli]